MREKEAITLNTGSVIPPYPQGIESWTPRSHSWPLTLGGFTSGHTEGGLYFVLMEECLYRVQVTQLCPVFCPQFLASLIAPHTPQHQFPLPEAHFKKPIPSLKTRLKNHNRHLGETYFPGSNKKRVIKLRTHLIVAIRFD